MDRAKACDYPQGRDESLGEGGREGRREGTVEVGDERPSAKLDNNTNLLDFSLWIAVRLSPSRERPVNSAASTLNSTAA